jgi:hypothetical protein
MKRQAITTGKRQESQPSRQRGQSSRPKRAKYRLHVGIAKERQRAKVHCRLGRNICAGMS